MSQRSFPFYRPPGQEGDQQAQEDDYYRLHRESGVLSGLNLTFNGLQWSLSPGEMFTAGSMHLVENTPETGLSAATTGSLPRRDMLVSRRTLTTDGQSTTTLAVISGTPATSPVDPIPTQERVGVFEEPLFSWQVPGGGGTTVTEVSDRRRWRDPDGGTGARGTIGYGGIPAEQITGGRTTTSSLGTRVVGNMNFAAHLVPGRIYGYGATGRFIGSQAQTVATAQGRISPRRRANVITDPRVGGAQTYIPTAGGNGYSFLIANYRFRVTVEDDYLISLWHTISAGTGTINHEITGLITQTIDDMGAYNPVGPSGISAVPVISF